MLRCRHPTPMPSLRYTVGTFISPRDVERIRLAAPKRCSSSPYVRLIVVAVAVTVTVASIRYDQRHTDRKPHVLPPMLLPSYGYMFLLGTDLKKKIDSKTYTYMRHGK